MPTAWLSSGETLGRLASALTDTGNALLSALSDTLERLAGPLTDLADRLAGTFADLARGLPSALPNVLHRPLGSFADLLDRLAGLADEMASTLAYLLGGMADPFEQLRIAIQRGQHSLENQGDVVEPRLQQGLGLDTLDLQLHFAQADIGADADLNQVAHLGHDRYLRSQIVHLDVDLIDLDDRNVEKDIGTVWQIVRIDDRVVGELVLRAGSLWGGRFFPVAGPGARA
ncbi:MAG TPA: hypothetical protein VHQ43_01015 [Solirubrobacterales bacterium]|nr:hypothetical protein [Solirubrobacterales bacterium]